MNFYNNEALRATLMNHDGQYQKHLPLPPGVSRFSTPREFVMQQPAENLGDGRVRLSYYNPDAKSVSVVGNGGSFQGEYPMEKDELGYWTVTVKVADGLHLMRYRVNGALINDASLPLYYGAGEPRNGFECVDDSCAWYLMQDVPHGDLRMEYYRSSYTGRWKIAWIYTPSGYDACTDDYPVLYLQHGMGEDETGWIDLGKINLILDNMIAAGECEKMIVVMTSGFAYREGEQFTMVGGFEEELIHDLMPFVEDKYRIRAERDSRAIAGLSMGSAQSQHIAYAHPDLFAYLGVIIGGFGTRWLREDQKFVDDVEFMKQFKLLFSSNGEQEDFCEASRAQIRQLNDAGMSQAVFFSTPGYHDLTTCRKSIREMLPLLFR